MENKNLDINEISAKVITSLATSAAKSIIEKTGNTIKDVQIKSEIALGKSFENYLKYAKDSNEKIKTLLYRHEPKMIRSFSEYIYLENDKGKIDTSDICNVLNIGNNIIVTGTAGAGKSVMMKLFFLDAISSTSYIPVLIELRGLNIYDNASVCLLDYIHKTMRKNKLDLDKTYFTYSLDTVNYLFLFDGFDEVKSDISQKVAEQIMEMSTERPKNHYIVTSRPSDIFIGWHSFQELSTVPLDKSQALDLISKLEYDALVKEQFYNALNSYLFDNYKTFASNPLLLTIMLLTYEKKASIPDRLNDFYEQAFSTLFNEHDATKGGYKRDIKSNLGYEDFRMAFSYFCFKSFFCFDYSFSKSKVLEYIQLIKSRKIVETDFEPVDYLGDLTGSVCVLIHDGLDYKFTHRSFQEYFSALYTMQLDDSNQQSLMKAWLNSYLYNENYLKIMYELQPNRFIKNVLAPPMKQLGILISKQKTPDQWLYCYIYDNIFAHLTPDGEYECIYSISNVYFYNILNFTYKLANYMNSELGGIFPVNFEKRSELAKILIENYGEDTPVPIKTIASSKYSNCLAEEFLRIKKIYDCSQEFISSKMHNTAVKKQSLSSIIDAL